MSKRDDVDLIEDVFISMKKILSYVSNMSYENFLEDEKTQDAVIRNIEIIGEAAKLISSEIKTKYKNIPWKMITGTRDRLIHSYFGINVDIIWEIATIDIPKLFKEIEGIKKDSDI